jgi:PTS system galactitol-specific IIC component
LITRGISSITAAVFSADDIQKRFGPFGEPVTVGFVMGLVIGALAGYDLNCRRLRACLAIGVRPSIIGLITRGISSITAAVFTGYDLKGILQLAVKTAAVMLLMPRVIKPIMDGLTPPARQSPAP